MFLLRCFYRPRRHCRPTSKEVKKRCHPFFFNSSTLERCEKNESQFSRESVSILFRNPLIISLITNSIIHSFIQPNKLSFFLSLFIYLSLPQLPGSFTLQDKRGLNPITATIRCLSFNQKFRAWYLISLNA